MFLIYFLPHLCQATLSFKKKTTQQQQQQQPLTYLYLSRNQKNAEASTLGKLKVALEMVEWSVQVPAGVC